MVRGVTRLREAAASAIVATFVVSLFLLGLTDHVPARLYASAQGPPDFARYVYLRNLSLPPEQARSRLVVVGDIHGMIQPLKSLMSGLRYNASSDLLVHVGDIVAKGSFEGSLAVLSYMMAHDITGVRGNHDQKVIEWRGWIDWVTSHAGGTQWLEAMETKTKKQLKPYLETTSIERWQIIPSKWEMLGDHYKIARAMSRQQYDYLLSLPLVLHIPALHSFVVHAGMLPLDPRHSSSSSRQPLSHVPSPPPPHQQNTTVIQLFQELALLKDIPQNIDPWVLINMRGIMKNNEITKKSDEGVPWSKLWNSVVGQCHGYDGRLFSNATSDDNLRPASLPCHPSTVIYGHAASRGLDVKRWSIGLDSGCVYGRQLTAMVFGGLSSQDFERQTEIIPYGESTQAQLTSVKC